jgi:hypothetical protein
MQTKTDTEAWDQMVGKLVRRKRFDRHPLRRLFAEIKNDARAARLTDREIDAELKRYRAERRR